MFKRENEQIEFKKSIKELPEAMKSVSGMLNKYGRGVIYFGVKNDGTLVKNDITDSSLRDVSRAIYESIEPRISPFIDTVTIDGIEIIKLSFEGNDIPYSAKGVYYIRTADENRSLSQKELFCLFQNRHYEDNWEKTLTDYTEDDIDDSTLEDFYNHAQFAGRLEVPNFDKHAILMALNLEENNKLTNAAYYLFGKNVNIELKLAVYASLEKINFIDLKSVKGNIYTLIGIGINYIKEHINWRVEFIGRHRTEIPEIPEKAIREIVANSFAHAKYSSTLMNTIDIYPSEIVITNQGSFPINYVPEDFIEKRVSPMRRNPLILDALFRSEDVEKSGSGFSRVKKICQEYNVPWDFNKLDNGFEFVFFRNNNINSTVISEKEENTNIQISENEKMLNLIEEKNNITIEELAQKLGCSDRKVQKIIKNLIETNKLARVGTKKGYWVIK